MTERMTAAEFLDASKPKGRQRAGGDNAKSTTVAGVRFDSRKEAKRWGVLLWRQKIGLIKDLKRQVPIVLLGMNGPILTKTGKKMTYRADFVYTDLDTNALVVEDAKGHPSDIYLMKKSILAAQGVNIKEV